MTVHVSDLTKRYGSTLALDSVTLTIASGEVHALLGHNGAGKSTLIRLLGGGTAPTSGSITIDGVEHASLDPQASIAAGIAVIYQHLSLIESLTVAENLFLGQELTRGRFIDKKGQARIARESLARVGAVCSPSDIVGALPIGQRQLVEIAKALQRDAKLLILDEPTAALSVPEAERLGRVVDELRSQGLAILYVTHLLNEVTRLADEVTVLRNGAVVWHERSESFTKTQLAAAITGGEPAALSTRDPRDPSLAARRPVLTLEGLEARSLGPVDLEVRPGEVVGLFGLMGSGRTRLLETVYGIHPLQAGRMRLAGEAYEPAGPSGALKRGVALVPADRGRQGLFGSLPAIENVLVRGMRKLAAGVLRSRARERQVFAAISSDIALRPPNPGLPASAFSGGNQQKLLLARWINSTEDIMVLLLDDPTQGVDVGARADIYSAIRELVAASGVSVIFSSSEPEEILALADRCVLMQGGRMIEDLDITDIDEESLLQKAHSTETRETEHPS